MNIVNNITRLISYIYRTNGEIRFVIGHNGILSKIISYHLKTRHHICISSRIICGDHLWFPHPQNVVLGEGVTIGSRCTIYQDVTIGQNKGEYPLLGNDIIVYPGAKIIGKVHIGDRAVIGANSLVINDVPEDVIVGGVPAVVVGRRDKSEKYY